MKTTSMELKYTIWISKIFMRSTIEAHSTSRLSAAGFCKCTFISPHAYIYSSFFVLTRTSIHTDCRMEIQRCRKEGIYDVGFMDTVVINQKTILEFEEDIKDRVLKFFIHQHFKKFILLPYNWGLVSTNSNLVLHITFIIVPSNMLSMFNSLIAQLPLDTAYHRNGKRNYYCA